jgi:hypothetical protein
MNGLNASAVIYTASATGVFSVSAGSRQCRLCVVGSTDNSPRAEQVASRRLLWVGASIPERCQIIVGGASYNPQPGTYADFGVYQRLDVVRAV